MAPKIFLTFKCSIQGPDKDNGIHRKLKRNKNYLKQEKGKGGQEITRNQNYQV